MRNMDKDLYALLNLELKSMQRASEILSKSYAICCKIGIKKDFSFEELTEFEALTSRFARLTDLLILKIFRLIDSLNLAPEGTIRDSIHRAEKNKLIESVDLLIETRMLRNQIAHECVIENLTVFFKRILELIPFLLECIERTENYCIRTFFTQ